MTSSSRLGLPPIKPKAASGTHAPRQREVSVLEIAAMPHVPVWDVRPYAERNQAPGYIPGSRSAPMTTSDAVSLPWQKIVEEAPCLVLVCLSGRRSGDIVDQLWAAGQERVLQLRGGVLEWQASGLSLCEPFGPEPPDWAAVQTLDDFKREVIACFVAESVWLHTALAGPEFVSPKSLVERVLAQPQALSSFDGALATLDLLAENLRRIGHPIDRLGSNLSAMRSVLFRLHQTHWQSVEVAAG